MNGANIITHPSVAAAPAPTGKFIQVQWNGHEYWLFSTKGIHRFHNQILDWFCATEAIPRQWVTRERLAVEDPGVRVLGGGRYSMDPERGELTLFDNSTAFGRFQEEGLAEKLAAADHPWSRMRLTIE